MVTRQQPDIETPTPPPRSRRGPLVAAAVAVVVILAGVGIAFASGAFESDDAASGAEEMPEILEEFYDAVLEGDASAMAALFIEDGGLTGPQEGPTRSDFSPPAVISQRMAVWFSYVDYSDVEHLDVIVEDDTVVVVSQVSGVSSTLERSSKTPFSTTIVDVFELRDGLIAQCDVYFDFNDVVS